MSNGEVCCILGVCCPPGSSAQFEHLVAMIQKSRPKLSQPKAEDAAHRVLEQHDYFRGVERAIDAQ